MKKDNVLKSESMEAGLKVLTGVINRMNSRLGSGGLLNYNDDKFTYLTSLGLLSLFESFDCLICIM